MGVIVKRLMEIAARDWDVEADPAKLLLTLKTNKTDEDDYRYKPPATDRKLRLFCAAVCRTLWDSLVTTDMQCIEEAELLADGLGSQGRFDHLLTKVGLSGPSQIAHWVAPIWDVTHPVSGWTTPHFIAQAVVWVEPVRMADIFRSIMPNPFRKPRVVWRGKTSEQLREEGFVDPRPIFPDWLLGIARGCYEQRLKDGALDPTRLLVLSDALEDEGMGGDVLGQLRSEGPHWRGMWALDYVLGKE